MMEGVGWGPGRRGELKSQALTGVGGAVLARGEGVVVHAELAREGVTRRCVSVGASWRARRGPGRRGELASQALTLSG